MKKPINKFYKNLWNLPDQKVLIISSIIVTFLLTTTLFLTDPNKILSLLIVSLNLLFGYFIIKLDKLITIKRFFGFFLFFNSGLLLSVLIFEFSPFYPKQLSLATLVYFLAIGNIPLYYITTLRKLFRIFLVAIQAFPFILSYSFITARNLSSIFFETTKNYLIFLGTFWLLEFYLFLIKIMIIRKYNIDLIEHFRAFLHTWLTKEKEYFEKILTKTKLRVRKFKLNILTLMHDNEKLALFSLPIHPGPFLTVGSSDLPSLLMNRNPLLMMPFHGFSTHKQDLIVDEDKNLLMEELERRLLNVNEDKILTCSKFYEIKTENFLIKGFLINETPLIIVAPKRPGVIDDIAPELDGKIRDLAKVEGFQDLVLIDAHNAHGSEIKEIIGLEAEILNGVKDLLKLLKNAKTEKAYWSFQKIQLADISALKKEICPGEGLLLLLATENFMNCLILLDANNIEHTLRNKIIEVLREAKVDCEVCSTDSHFMTGKLKGNDGYYPLGSNKESHELVIKRIIEALEKAKKRLKEGYVGKLVFLTPEFKILGNLAEIYEKGSEFVKFGKLLPYLALVFSATMAFLV